MTLFFISASLLVVLSMAWLLVGLFRVKDAGTDQEAVNITLARERRQTLDKALADGSIDQASYDYEREQLQFDLAADLRLDKASRVRPGGQISAAVLVAVFVPISAGALYLHLGNPAAITQARDMPMAADTQATTTAPALAELLPQIEARLAQEPDDIDGWRLLGRSYLSVGDFAKARTAFEKALALDEQDVPTLAQLAEAVAMTQQGNLAGEPIGYVTRALALDPDNEHALFLGSIAQQQAGNHDAALQGFNRLAAMADGNLEALSNIEQMRSRSVAALAGLQVGSGATDEPATGTQPSDETAADSDPATGVPAPVDTDAGNASISVSVSLSDQARAATSADQVVFIYATATQGPPMPLAVSRVSVADLPITVTLDNSMAMIPTMTLATFPSVTIGARVSTTGNAIAQSGDWFQEAGNIDPTNTPGVELTIDQQKP